MDRSRTGKSSEDRQRLPRLLEFLAIHLGIGFAVGVVFASMIVIGNVSGLQDLIVGSQEPFLVLGLLYGLNGLTFASVSMGIGVMTLPMDEVVDLREKQDQDDR